MRPRSTLLSLALAGALVALLPLAAPRVLGAVAHAAPHGGGTRAFLGLATEPSPTGLVVVEVVPGSPAALAGLQPGDTLTRIEHATPRTHAELAALVAAWVPGRAVSLQLRRGGSLRTVRATLAAVPRDPAATRGTLIGAPAPELGAELIAGPDPVRLDALRGRVVVLDFWATWCGPCRAVMPELDRLSRQYHDRGLTVLGLTDERLDTVRAHLARSPVSYTIARDVRGTSRRYGVTAMPTLVVIDRAGQVRELTVGADAAALQRLRQQVELLLAEPAP